MGSAFGAEGCSGKFWFRNTILKGLLLAGEVQCAEKESRDYTSRDKNSIPFSGTVLQSVLYICPDCRSGAQQIVRQINGD